LIYDPRGNKKREFLTANKMLIGISGAGEGEICIANLAFRTVERSVLISGSRTAQLQVQSGPMGRVAILCDEFPKGPAGADPKVLGNALTRDGVGVTMLTGDDLADSNTLTAANFNCLILPYGPNYPYAAYDSIISYLKSGGSFLSIGGYAFDEPCARDQSGRFVHIGSVATAEEIAVHQEGIELLNTRHGKPGDQL
jgi:hypothetical protein